MNTIKFITFFLIPIVLTALCGCSKNDKENLSSTVIVTKNSEAISTAASYDKTEPNYQTNTTEETVSIPSKNTTEPTVSEKTSEITEGYSDALSAAKDYYNAYINHDAEAVYSMFNKDEIEGFYEIMKSALEGKSADEVFRKAAVIRAIESSMDSMKVFMDNYAVSANDKWSVTITNKELEEVKKEKLDEFNTSLGTSYTSGFECRYIFYLNDNNGESFQGNSSAFLEKDGKWYLSFSNAMGTDLLNYIELE